MKKRLLAVLALVYSTLSFSQNYYISPSAVNGNGSKESPFSSFAEVIDNLQPGDTCFVDAGNYYEEAVLVDIKGTAEKPIVITSWKKEKAVLNGTKELTTSWSEHSTNIYKTTIDQTIWQLFIDGKEQVMARWPNGQFSDESIYHYTSWSHTDGNNQVNAISTDTDLASAGFDATGAIGILNFGSFKTYARKIKNHQANSDYFEYDSIPKSAYRTKHQYYYLECALALLDTHNEWYFDNEIMELYVYAEDKATLEAKTLRGKTQDYALRLENCEYLQIEDIDFFATTIDLYKSKYITVENAQFDHPNCSKRMLKNTGMPAVTRIYQQGKYNDSYCTFKSCSFAYTDGEALRIRGKGNKIEDCLFHHIDYSCAELEGLMVTINVNGIQNEFSHNTVYMTGASSVIVPGEEPIFTFNDVTNTGHLQSDGAVLQGTKSTVKLAELSYNWIYQTPKYALRFDAPGGDPGAAGTEGTMHHNVVWQTNGLMVKGDYHHINNNTVFDGSKNDLIILAEDNSNVNSIIKNNLAQKIAGHRSGHISSNPVPATAFSNNWNGYIETDAMAKEQVRDHQNLDFRPLTSLIDAGTELPDHPTDVPSFSGSAPDIGAYEDGETYWMPGQRRDHVYRTVPPSQAGFVKPDADLLWLESLNADHYIVYFSDSYASVRNRSESARLSNIQETFADLPLLDNGKTYFWRVDAVQENGSVNEGAVQWFTVGTDAFMPDTSIIQTITLTKGWNLVSLYIQPYNQLTGTVFPNASLVKNFDGFYSNSNEPYLNSLIKIEGGEGYLVYNQLEETISIKGMLIEENHLTLLSEGWNLIGVPNKDGLATSLLPTGTEIAKDFDLYYSPDIDFNTLLQLNAGKAYFIKMQKNAELQW